MKQVTVDMLRQLSADARESIWAQAAAQGREPKIYLHWTAGRYYTKFDDYHVNIDGDGVIWLMDDLDEILAHTWRRNSGAVGITVCAAYGANTYWLGTEAATAQQLETMAQAVCAVADGLWLTINKKYVLTHGEAADNEDGEYIHEPYGPRTTCERWDLEYLGNPESMSFNPWATNGTRGGDVLRRWANTVRAANNAKILG